MTTNDDAGTNGAEVAVIGAGVAGLTAAYLLRRRYVVTLFEAADRLGGHAHTHQVEAPGGATVFLDSGFIVYNAGNYPHLVRLFRELGVPTQPSDMSLSVSCRECGLEYVTGSGLRGRPARPPGISRSTWAEVSRDTVKFSAQATDILGGAGLADLTLGEMLADGGYHQYFVGHVILPLVSAVWSCEPGLAQDYPARYLLRFLATHGLLPGGQASRWRTVAGGSHRYVEAVARHIPHVRTSTAVHGVRRLPDHVEIRDETGATTRCSAVVIAVHPDQALGLLEDPTPAERDVLGCIPYVRNNVVLHTDGSVLPKDERNRGAWNFGQPSCSSTGDHPPAVHYYLNQLQRIRSSREYVVTVQETAEVDDRAVLNRMVYEHPVYTVRAVAARRRLSELNTAQTAYAGAYHGWGFHEDGCLSGVRAAAALGVTW